MARLRNVLPRSSICARVSSRAAHSVRRLACTAAGGCDAMAAAIRWAAARSSASRHHLGDEADLEGPCRADALVVAEQGHAHDLAERHAVEHQRRLEHGRHAVGDVRVEERGVVGGHDDVGLAEQVEGAAAGHAVHRRDHRLPALVAAWAEPAAGVDVGERIERVLDAVRRRAPRRGRCPCRTPCRRRR